MELAQAGENFSMEDDHRRDAGSRQAARSWAGWIVRGAAPHTGSENPRHQNNGTASGAAPRLRRDTQMKHKTIIFLNGILTNPEDVEGWTDRAEAWVETKLKVPAEKMEYRAGMLTRRWKQAERVQNLEKIVARLGSRNLILIGHSNGCDIIERFVKRGLFNVAEVHLIAAASEADFTKTWNEALQFNRVGMVNVYWSKKDRALKQAKISKLLLGWLGLGYGYLGLVGPQNVAESIRTRVFSQEKDFDHSDWIDGENLEDLLHDIFAGDVK